MSRHVNGETLSVSLPPHDGVIPVESSVSLFREFWLLCGRAVFDSFVARACIS